MEPYWNVVEEIIKESDVVLNVLDARFVNTSRNKRIEELLKEKGRAVIYVVNKADLVSKRELEIQIDKLKEETKSEIVYVSNRQKRTVRALIFKIKQVFGKCGKRKEFIPMIKRPYREAKADIIVGVVGYPNVGKSSLINAISFKKKAKVAKKAGTTHGGHWITAGEHIRLIDSPGVIPLGIKDETQLGLMAVRSLEKIKEPEIVAAKIIDFFMEKKKNIFEEYYRVKIPEGLNSYEILEFLAKEKHHLRKGGFPDEIRTGQMIIKDWQDGKLKL